MEGEAKTVGNPLYLGESLPVDNVQALAATYEDLADQNVPHRYVRPDGEAEPVDLSDGEEVPVVDLARLLDPATSDDEAARLNLACEEWGFFQLANHGVAGELTERMKADAEEFFGLPLGEKEAYAQLPGGIEGYGHAFVASEEQKLDWGDMYEITTQPAALRNMRFWPTHPPTFRDTLDKYSVELIKVADCLLGFMATNLGLQPEELTNLFNNGLGNLKINYYPPCPRAHKVLGLSPHSDAVALTLLLQANQVQGLQIKRNGRWLPVKPIPNVFVINIGDILEIFSNGRYKSIEHRVVINPIEKRISIAMFFNPNYDTLIGPLPKLFEGIERYKTISLEDFAKYSITNQLDGKNPLEKLKIQS